MTELNRRLLVTGGAVCAAQVLYAIPAPGLSPFAVGSLGLAPYLAASIVAALIALFRSGRAIPAARVLQTTMLLTVAIALLMSLATASTLNGMIMRIGLGRLPLVYWVLHVGTMTAGALILMLLSHAISVRGIGNGVCILVSAQLVGETFKGLLQAASKGNAFGENPLLLFLLAAGWSVLLVNWMRKRWVVRGPDPESDSATSPARLSVNGIGSLGMIYVFSLLAGFLGPQATFPWDSQVYSSLEWVGGMQLPHFVAFVILSTVVGAFWTAQVYDRQGLPRSLRGAPDRSKHEEQDENAFDRQVWRATSSYVLLSPMVVAILLFAFPRLGVLWLSPMIFLPVVATYLDTAEQWRVHRHMAKSEPTEDQALCEGCGQPVEQDALHCAACGTVFSEGLVCEVHADRPAFARCVLCSLSLCDECDHPQNGRHLCGEHRLHDLVEGWVTVARAGTRLRGEALVAELHDKGIPAAILANDAAPLYGTRALYETRHLVPLAVHPACGGGAVRVLVPAAMWRRVSTRSRLDPGEPEAAAVSAAGST